MRMRPRTGTHTTSTSQLHPALQVLKHHTRRSPVGQGTKTYDHYQLSIHKRVIDLYSVTEVVKQITSISIEPGVEVEVTIQT